ncbi:MAG: helix-turn-helix domain-containing protein [Lachnospiraceae bacterium]
MTKQAELKKQAYESDLKSRALSVLIYLIDRSNKDLTCFPAIGTMAKHLHISVSTVKRALRELLENGYIEKNARYRDNQGQTSNLYILILKDEQNNSVKTCDGCLDQQKEAAILHLTFTDLAAAKKFDEDKLSEKRCKQKKLSLHMNQLPMYSILHRKKRVSIMAGCYPSLMAQHNSWTGEEANLIPP